MKKKKGFTEYLRWWLMRLSHYLKLFMMIAFLITCCVSLFSSTMATTLGIELTEEIVKNAAIVTFGNVLLLSFFCTVLDELRRKITVDRHVNKIVSAAEKIAGGDYSVRIKPLRTSNRTDGLDKIVDCFNTVADELSGVEKLKNDFISNVSHEIKTPLAVMQNYGTMLTEPNLSEEKRQEYAEIIISSSQRMTALVTNILKLNKLENQTIFPKSESFDLKEQICECLLEFEQLWEEKEIEIFVDLDENVLVNTNPELLSIVWNNLFSNAIKFTDRGGEIHVKLKKDGDAAIVSVRDTGCGIDKKTGEHIFEKFYQGDTSHSTEGNGLGLSLVKRVLDIVDGEITVSSELGNGSEFTVRLKCDKHE